MTHGDEQRGTEVTDCLDCPECALSIIKHARAGMEPDEAAAVADLLPSMVSVAALEFVGWSTSPGRTKKSSPTHSNWHGTRWPHKTS